MKAFMDDDFLLRGPTAKLLYHKHAKQLPICDYHCHIEAEQLAKNENFTDIDEVWLAADHYKWRAMRFVGCKEEEITGPCTPEERFDAWAKTLPLMIGNPLYHWTHLELKRYFGIEEQLSPQTAKAIRARCNAMLASDDFKPLALLERMKVRVLCTTNDPMDDLRYHRQLKAERDALKKEARAKRVQVFPAFRPDRAIWIQSPGFLDFHTELEASVGYPLQSFEHFVDALKTRIEHFHAHGCRLADHGLNEVYAVHMEPSVIEAIYQKALRKEALSSAQIAAYTTAIQVRLAKAYLAHGWTMQLHMSVVRNANSDAFAKLGPDHGFDCMGEQILAPTVIALLDLMKREAGGLPRTLLFSLNEKDNLPLLVASGAFQKSGEASWAGIGPAWWFLDQQEGMRKHLKDYASVACLPEFMGMETDSRSLLSYTRHEYFRRILCDVLGAWVDQGEYPMDEEMLARIVRKICYENAMALFTDVL